ALPRARMCELIAEAIHGGKRQASFFTVGLLSTIDAFMDAPLQDLLSNTSLSQQLHDALISTTGTPRIVPELLEHYQPAEWNEIDWDFLAAHNITPENLSHIYLEALGWVNKTAQSMGIGQT